MPESEGGYRPENAENVIATQILSEPDQEKLDNDADRASKIEFLRSLPVFKEEDKESLAQLSNEDLEGMYDTYKYLIEKAENSGSESNSVEPTQETPQNIQVIESEKKIEAQESSVPALNLEAAKPKPYATKEDLKPQVKEIAEKKIEGWEEVDRLLDELKAKGVNVVKGIGLDPAESLEAYKKLEHLVNMIPADTYKNQYFVADKFINGGKGGVYVRPGRIAFDPNSSLEELHEAYIEHFGLGGKPEKKGPEISKLEMSEIKEGEAVVLSTRNNVDITLQRKNGDLLVSAPAQNLHTPQRAEFLVAIRFVNDESDFEKDLIPDVGYTAVFKLLDTGKTISTDVIVRMEKKEKQEPKNEKVKEGQAKETRSADQPKTNQEIQDQLNKTRLSYIEAKRRLLEFNAMQEIKAVSPEQLKKIYEKAAKEYDEARTEYVGNNVERYFQEKDSLANSHLEKFSRLEKGSTEKVLGKIDWFMGLSIYDNYVRKNGREYETKKGNFIAKRLTIRNAIYGGLLGAGAFGLASGVMPIAVGFAAYNTARKTGKLLEQGREWLYSYKPEPEKIKTMSMEEVQEGLGRLNFPRYLHGKTEEEIQGSATYKALKERETQLVKEIAGKQNGSDLLHDAAVIAELAEDKWIRKDKTSRRWVKGISLLAAGANAGVIRQILEYYQGGIPKFKIGDYEFGGEELEQAKPKGKIRNVLSTEDANIENPKAGSITSEVKSMDPESGSDVRVGPENIEKETLDFEQLRPKEFKVEDLKGTEIKVDKNELLDIELGGLEKYQKTSDALKHLLKDGYKDFMNNTVGMDAKELNKIQEMKVSDFLSQFSHNEIPPMKKREWTGLANSLENVLKNANTENLENASIRDALIKLSAERARSNA